MLSRKIDLCLVLVLIQNPISQEKWLQDQGVDTTTPKNKELQSFFEILDKFTSDWLNDVPTEEATTLILPPLQEAYATIEGNTKADKEVIDTLLV